jgi:uncharacterized membrane protein
MLLMSLHQYKALILIVTAVSALLIASPLIQQFIAYPQTDYLTELSLFGPYQNATYPYNIVSDNAYQFYLDVTNRLGSSAYYVIEVKFRNQTQSSADSFNHSSSELPPLSQITFFAADKQSIELPFTVTFNYHLKNTQIEFSEITVNGYPIDFKSTSIDWDSQKNGFFGNLFFELWIFNGTVGSFQYNQRYVSLWFKLNV